jgi:FkbM family methyltransferase
MVNCPGRDEMCAYVEALPFDADTKRRILMTARCPDADSIPKVSGAGDLFEEAGCRFQLMHNGIRVLEDCYYGRWMTELIRLLRGHHEPQEERVFHEILKYLSTNGTMIELGSFWSYYSLWFHSSVAQAKTFMVEPDPNNLEIGRRNFALNKCSGAFFNLRVAKASSQAEPFQCESDAILRPIPKIAMDDFIHQNAIDFVDLLLADVQGAELEMLEGARKSIAQGKIRFLVLSTHHHSISKDPILHQRCLQFLKDRGAHILASHSVPESYSGDGLIAASLVPADCNIPSINISKNEAGNSLFREAEFDLAEAEANIATLRKKLGDLSVIQDCQSRELETLRDRNTKLQALLSEREALISKLLHSTSWKISRPVRTLAELLRRIEFFAPKTQGKYEGVKLGMHKCAREWQAKLEDARHSTWHRIFSVLPEIELVSKTPQGTFTFSSKDQEIGRQLFLKKTFDHDKVERGLRLLADLGYLVKGKSGYLLDIGANVGTVCIPLVMGGTFANALAFEAEPRNYSFLMKNIKNNGVSKAVRAFNYALSSAEGLVDIELSSRNFGDHRVRTPQRLLSGTEQFVESTRKVIQVRACRLDDVLSSVGVEPKELALVWMDVQGHEKHVLDGAQTTLRFGTPVIAEFWPYGLLRAGVSPDSFIRFASSHFAYFYDLNQAFPGRQSSIEVATLFERYQGISFTDLLLLKE